VGSVTIATNIAGRGVDIVLGGTPPPNPKFVLGKEKINQSSYQKAIKTWQKDHDQVVSLGGLYVIGTERHESRRIDNQLRGRSGRQGDPGATRFYLSLEDDIMRIFGGDQVAKVMTLLKIPENEPIEHGMVSRAIEQAQVKVEGFNFDARKHVVEYDDVMNKQRQIIYDLRKKVLTGGLSQSEVVAKIKSQLKTVVDIHAPKGIVGPEAQAIASAISETIPFDDFSREALASEFSRLAVATEVKTSIDKLVDDATDQLTGRLEPDGFDKAVKFAYLSSIDHLWIDHLDSIDNLREGIGLRGYGQRDPLVEYKAEAFSMFERLVVQIDSEFTKRLFRIQLAEAPAPLIRNAQEIKQDVTLPQINEKTDFLSAIKNLQKTAVQNSHKNLGRNDRCWCNSGKKYKHCHYPN
jgi:preprotein translocase subunit SecA